MISAALLSLLACPRCQTRVAPRSSTEPDSIAAAAGSTTAPLPAACPHCGALFTAGDGYLIAPTPTHLAGRETHYHQADFAATLSFRQVAQPFLGAAVRQRWLKRWLFDRCPTGPILEVGCGDGRFLYWNHHRTHVVGIDPVPLFSREALAQVDLVQGDARALPFPDGAFAAAYSIDVFEHLDADGLEATMAEIRRVLAPGGLFFLFTNTREPSTFQPIITAERHLAQLLRRRGIGDFAADDLRKGDHVKALATFEDVVLLTARHRFILRERRFWNGIAQGLIDNILVRLGEHLLLGRANPTATPPGSPSTTPGSAARSAGAVAPMAASSANMTAIAESATRPIATPSGPGAGLTGRQAVSRRGPVALALAGLTLAMQADVELLGHWRSGPFFALLERQ